jgi:hypothetical protein
VVEPERQAAGRAAAPQEGLKRRGQHREAALFDLVPEGISARRQHQAVIERYGIGRELRRFVVIERDALVRLGYERDASWG